MSKLNAVAAAIVRERTHESPIHSWNLMGPLVVSASKSGAVFPRRRAGMVMSVAKGWWTIREGAGRNARGAIALICLTVHVQTCLRLDHVPTRALIVIIASSMDANP